jgi:hypothetical protein
MAPPFSRLKSAYVADQMKLSGSLTPTYRLNRAGIDRLLAVAGIALVRTDDVRFLVDELEHPGTDLRTMAASDAEFLVHDGSFHDRLFSGVMRPVR